LEGNALNDVDICRALIVAVSAVHHDTVLTDTEKITTENALLNLRQLVAEENILRKVAIFDRLKDIAQEFQNGDRTVIEFDESKLINLFGVSIGLIMGKELTCPLSVGFKKEYARRTCNNETPRNID
jgi:hypothetical protein